MFLLYTNLICDIDKIFPETVPVEKNIEIEGTDGTYTLNNLPKGLSWDGSILTMDNFPGKYIRQGSHATDLKEITINVVGDANKLTAGNREALLFDSGITIQGTGTLTLESKHTSRAVSHNTTIQGSAKVTINIDKSIGRAVFGNVTVKASGKLDVNTVGEDISGSSIRVADNIYLEDLADIKLNLTNGISTQSYASIASNIPYIEGKYNNTGKYYEKAAYKVVGEWNATNGGYAGGENQIKLTYTVPNSVDKLYTSGGDENSDIYMKIWAPSTSSPSITMYNNAEFTGGGVTSIDILDNITNKIYVKTEIGIGESRETKYYIITIMKDTL